VRKPIEQIPPASTEVTAVDEINKEIAFYNRTGNMLALWAVLSICAREDIKLPVEVASKFGQIADQLLEYSRQGTPAARSLVADLTLGTKNESGGPSVFRDYALHKRNSSIAERTFALLLKHFDPVGGSSTDAGNTGDPPKLSQGQVYEIVANEFGTEPETVKRLFEEDDRNAGSFGYRALKKMRKADGVIEV
jgi:hypothetical protein